MKKTEKSLKKDEVKELSKDAINAIYEDILSFDYYNYRLENLARKIRTKNLKAYLKA